MRAYELMNNSIGLDHDGNSARQDERLGSVPVLGVGVREGRLFGILIPTLIFRDKCLDFCRKSWTMMLNLKEPKPGTSNCYNDIHHENLSLPPIATCDNAFRLRHR